MSARRSTNNRIRGPQSALTEFLAANNISAVQIRDTFLRRRAAADAQAPADLPAELQAEALAFAQSEIDDTATEASTSSKKRKRTDPKSKTVAKKSQLKKSKKPSDDDDFDIDSDNALSNMYKKAVPLPGQLENCEICDKRFTVTPYSKSGPDGGLICTPCGKQLKNEEKVEKKAKAGPQGKKRRQVESNRLDGIVKQGAKSLQQLCIEKVADHHHDIEEFGDLPETVLDRLSEIFSKRRVMDPRTVRLFLRPDLDKIAIHDAANLTQDDYKQIFAIVPNLKTLILRNASQFKDEVLSYMIEKAACISHFQVYGANLITDEAWRLFFTKYGHNLETLALQWLDASFDDDIVKVLVESCVNLHRLKLKFCRKITAESIPVLSKLDKLEHISLQLSDQIEPDQIISLVAALGPNLKTLSLENVPTADDSLISTIRTHCTKLEKLRLTDNCFITDAAFASLFSPFLENTEQPTSSESWNNPGLRFIDFSSTRDVDNTNPTGPTDVPIGLGSNAFTALMEHSGNTLRTLNIASCRHISHASFCDVFNGSVFYPALEEVNLSFCNSVDAPVIHGIFNCCPKLNKLIAFGCFKIDQVVLVPKDVALIGVPKAQDAIEQYGSADVDFETTLGRMIDVGA